MRRVGSMAPLVVVVAAAASAQGGQTAQGAYNAGQAAFDTGRWADANVAYETTLRLMNPASPAVPVVRARRATALMNLRQTAAARAEAQAAIAQFGERGVTAGEDLAAAWTLVGTAARFDLDEPAAADAYTRALGAAGGENKALLIREARLGLALATMTSDPARASTTLDAVLAAPDFTTTPKAQQAEMLALRGRAALNGGDARAAAGFVDRALQLTGTTTTRVNIAQVRIRGDAALVYAKLGDNDKVRLYLTYSGAGHVPDSGWLNRGDNELPVCGADLRPDDMAVVELAIDDKGRAIGAAPVYASRPGAVGATFARAVRAWRWSPDYVKKLDAFWRASIRVELRCVTRPPGVDLADGFREEVESWAAAQGVSADLTDPALRSADVMAGAAPAARVLEALLNAVHSEREPNWDRAAVTLTEALDKADASAAVRAYVLRRMIVAEGIAGRQQQARVRLDGLIEAIARRPDGARPAAWLRAERAFRFERDDEWTAAQRDLAAVTALPSATLGADDSVRTVAVLHQAMIERHFGQGALADSRLAAAGVNADSCSILDVKPVATNQSISSSAFPEEALSWRFEGSVREAFDINADGSVAGVRTVIAYPPLVFGPATERAVRRFRYIVPTLGDKPLGCAGQTVNVRYVLPR